MFFPVDQMHGMYQNYGQDPMAMMPPPPQTPPMVAGLSEQQQIDNMLNKNKMATMQHIDELNPQTNWLQEMNGGKPLTLQDYMSLGTMASGLGGAVGSAFKPPKPPQPIGLPGAVAPHAGAATHATQLMGSLAAKRRGGGYRV